MKKKRGFLDGYKTYDDASFKDGERGAPSEWRKAFRACMGMDEAKSVLDDAHLSPRVVLGVSLHASVVEIKRAYRKLALECHPDRAVINKMSKEVAEEAFKRLVAAYTIIMDSH
jgi:DnaJ-domain-containing protein 1